MNKKTALITLVNSSYLLSDELKKEMLNRVDSFTDEQIDSLGKFLALQKKKSLETNLATIKSIDKLMKLLNAVNNSPNT